ncbi:hypothetical protein Acsp05_71280 [Actinokineospora sp. NBRC 105648]|nr:hypothetical protein Acsp05_71280 [Actinokineospora sp. NBRC 105648]
MGHNWRSLLRDVAATQDPDQLRDLWWLAHEEAAPHERGRLLAQIEALGRAARKTADRLAAERGEAPAPVSQPAATPPPPVVPAAPSVAPVPPAAGGYVRRKAARAATPTAHDAEQERVAWAEEVRGDAIEPDATEDEVTTSLAVWHEHVQVLGRPVRFVGWRGQTAIDLYTLLAAANGAMVQPERLRSELARAISAGTADAGTRRGWAFVNPDTSPRLGQQVIEFDVTAQFPGAARSTECGDGEPDLIESPSAATVREVAQRAGYARLAARPDLSGLRPAARYSLARIDAGVWIAAPEVKYLHGRGVDLDVDQVVLWPRGRHGRRLAVWSSHVLTARTTLTAARDAGEPGAALALAVLKLMYSTFLGGLLASADVNRSDTLRHDWRDQVSSQAGTNALRAMDKLPEDVDPIGGQIDAFWFVADDADYRPPGLVYSDLPDLMPKSHQQPGKWHRNRHGLITPALIDAHAKGRHGSIQRAVIAADDLRKGAGAL